MKLCIFTIVLDGMPFIKWQYECFQKLTCDWQWIVVEGAAQNNGSTRWCRPQEVRPSRDGTLEFIQSLASDARVQGFGGDWSSKDEMVNRAVETILGPCVLMEIDVDEMHKPQAIDKVAWLFENDPTIGMIRFPCRYFVGPKLICVGSNCWSNWDKEYDRAWRFTPGASFVSHEPPVLNVVAGRTVDRKEAADYGLTFDHLAYVTESQVAYKESFYPYDGLLNQWRALQRNTSWPAKLSRFFPHVSGDLPTVRKIN